MTTVTGTTYFTRLPDGLLLSERTPSGTAYYLIDGLNSVLAVANSAGNVVNSYSYDPFGSATSTTEQVANPFRFDGQYLDQATGFYKMGAWCDVPAVSWWTREDPVSWCARNPQSLNRYPFVENDLVNAVDPTGNQIINPGFVACFETCLGAGLLRDRLYRGLLRVHLNSTFSP